MLPLSAFFAAALLQLHGSASTRRTLLFATLSIICLFLLASSRPPYTALGLLILTVGMVGHDATKRMILIYSSCIAIGCSLAWSYYIFRFVFVPFGSDTVNYFQQLQFMVQNPANFLETLFSAICNRAEIWSEQMLGILGWLDARLPSDYYPYAGSLFIIGILFYFLESPGEILAKELIISKLVTFSILFVAFLGILFALYITWNPVGHNDIKGVQGRYFLPLLFASSLLLYRSEPDTSTSSSIFADLRLFTLALFGVSAIIATLETLFSRYYG